jgi:uncharacterized protein involved in exopolysaccharide biosynthesis
MRDSFDAFEYLRYLRARWRFLAVTCGVALAISLAVSLLTTNRYTATASILIEPPAVNDPRAATAISPVYLESLKAYESFASSDTLFARALERFHLRDVAGSAPIEALKRRVLKVRKLKDTSLLEISVTLPNPKQAQEVAQSIAEETVALSRAVGRGNDQEIIDDAQKQEAAARANLEEARAAWGKISGAPSAEALQAEVTSLVAQKSKIEDDLAETGAGIAEYAAREKRLASEPGELERTRQSLAEYRARAELLEKHRREVAAKLNAANTQLARQSAREEELQANLKLAQNLYDAAARRLAELRSSAGLRSERLQMIDPGIVPQRPSAPNTLLNSVAGAALGALIAVLYLSAAFGASRRAGVPGGFRIARHGDG